MADLVGAEIELDFLSPLDADCTQLVLQQLPATGLARLACVSRATRICVDYAVMARKAALGARLPPWAPNGPLLSAIHFVELQDGLPLRSLAAGSTFSLVVSPRDGRLYSFGGPSEPGGSCVDGAARGGVLHRVRGGRVPRRVSARGIGCTLGWQRRSAGVPW
jgi:hypothetical protein